MGTMEAPSLNGHRGAHTSVLQSLWRCAFCAETLEMYVAGSMPFFVSTSFLSLTIVKVSGVDSSQTKPNVFFHERSH